MGERKRAFTIREGSSAVAGYRYAGGRFCLAYRKFARGPLIRETKTGEKAARERAREIAISLANGVAQVIDLTGADRDSYLQAKTALQTFGIPLHAAIEEYVAAKKILRSHSILEAAQFFNRGYATRKSCPDTTEILAQLLSQIDDRRRSDKYRAGIKRDLERFGKQFPDIGAPAEDDLRKYLGDLRDRKEARVSQRRRDNVRDAIVRLFRFARDRGYIADRTSAAEKIERLNPGTEVSTYTPGQLALFLEHVSRDWLPWLVLGAFAGLRTSEIFRLDWSAVKWGHKAIAVPATVAKKIRLSRLVPASDNLLAWLGSWRSAKGPLYTGTRAAIESRQCREIARLKRATGLAWRENALRHSFGSYRLAVVKSFDQVALEMGNSVAKVRQNYNDPKLESEARSWFSLMPPETVSNVVPMTLDLRFK